MPTTRHRHGQQQTEDTRITTDSVTATKAARIQALDAAYEFAVKTEFIDFGETDRDAIAGVAADYALECWQDWLPDVGATSDQQVSVLEDQACAGSWDCTPHIPMSAYFH